MSPGVDYLLRGASVPLTVADLFLAVLAKVPFEAVLAGSILGATAIPLRLLGLWPVYRAPEPVSRRLAIATVLLFGFGIAVGSGYHAAYAFYAGGYQALEAGVHGAPTIALVVPWLAASAGFVVTAVWTLLFLLTAIFTRRGGTRRPGCASSRRT